MINSVDILCRYKKAACLLISDLSIPLCIYQINLQPADLSFAWSINWLLFLPTIMLIRTLYPFFCLSDLFCAESGMLKCPIIKVFPSIFPFISYSFSLQR